MKLVDVVPADLGDGELVRAGEVGRWLGVTIHTIYNWCRIGRLPALKKLGGRTVRLNVGEVRAALRKMDRLQNANEKE